MHENYKEKVFPDVECSHSTIKDAALCIACTPVKPNNIIHMKCALVFLYKFPNYIIHNEELYGEPNGPLICFSVYIHQVRCAKHGIFLNGSTLCKLCEENYDINNDLIKRPEYGKKKHLTKISC